MVQANVLAVKSPFYFLLAVKGWKMALDCANKVSRKRTNMGEVVPFKRPKASEKHRGKSLCRSGFHKWKVETQKQFDVKSGKLVTSYRCERCGAHKTTSH